MRETTKENMFYNFFIPPSDYLDNPHANGFIKSDENIKIHKTLFLEQSAHLKEIEKKLKFITSVSLCLSSSLDYDTLLTRLFKELAKGTGVDALSLIVNPGKTAKTSIVSSLDLSSSVKRDIAKQAADNLIRVSKNSISKISKRIDFLYAPAGMDKDTSHKQLTKFTPQSFYSIQSLLKANGDIIGIICLHKFKQTFTISESDLFFSITAQIAHTLTNSIRYKRFRKLANRDGLTGTLNRRVFDDILKREYSRATRYSLDLSVIFIDIDHFKKINDSFGHQAGDAVLKKISSLIQKSIRENDILARYGGEEFVLLLPETGGKLAFKTAERIRVKLEKNIFLNNEVPFHVTASMGVSSLTSGIYIKGTPEEMLNQADAALYIAKNRGRNQVVSAD